MDHPIYITAVGMTSALGWDVQNCCAAARAGLNRAKELTCTTFRSVEFGRETIDGFPQVIGHVVSGIDGFTGSARLLLLGSAALKDLLVRTELSLTELRRTGICLNISDYFIEQRAAEALYGTS